MTMTTVMDMVALTEASLRGCVYIAVYVCLLMQIWLCVLM